MCAGLGLLRIGLFEKQTNVMKDNFSQQSALYAQFRPQYPEALFEWLYGHVRHFDAAWDCGTGNGQVAQLLSGHFQEVYATDISEKQLLKAPALPNVRYVVEAGEQCGAADAAFDLIVVAQAVHWFDFDRFYSEVRRTLRPDGLLALIGYDRLRTDEAVNQALDHFYWDVVGPYWDAERKLVDNHYANIPFPFEEIQAPEFGMTFTWSYERFIGYLNTWSAVQHYIRQRGENPVDLHLEAFHDAWGTGEKQVTFPVFMRVGRLNIDPSPGRN
jgi:SAM-dependent methyltransferase